jgi:hypothetical protein
MSDYFEPKIFYAEYVVDDVGWMKKKQKNVVACICSN